MQCPECGKPHTLSKHASHEARLARWRAQPPGPAGEKTARGWAAPRKAPKRVHPWEDHTDLLADLRDDSYGYVYRLYDARGVIIYVGQTKGALAVRLAAHVPESTVAGFRRFGEPGKEQVIP